MNESIDLTKILKNCPVGTKLYSTVHGEVQFVYIKSGNNYPIVVRQNNKIEIYTAEGKLLTNVDGECILFPSREQRNWSKFIAPWYKKDKFDPKTLRPFDKVLVRDLLDEKWNCDLFSLIRDDRLDYPYETISTCCAFCIPYNDDTKHLVGTADEAPEFYRYWED